MSTISRSIWSLAWRESRTARRRLLLYMSSISLGVAALVAIDSFSTNIVQSVKDQSRALMGGDVSFNSSKPFAPAMDSLFDSLSHHGLSFARITTFPSMAVVPRTAGTRFAQVRGVTDNYPFYGNIVTEPAGLWPTLQGGANAIVDPSLLTSLNAKVGDTLRLGFGSFTIIATIKDVPAAAGIAEMLGPRIFIPARYIAETQLVVFGSTADRTVLAKLPPNVDPDNFVKPLRKRIENQQVRVRTVTQTEMQTSDAIENLTSFIGIVGLVALLLGGIGVASGVRAFVARKIDTVAVLRCLGASSGQVMAIYVVQAAGMGLAGAAAGAALGVAIQFLLPQVLTDFLPIDVKVRLVPAAVFTGLAVGGWIALIFALRPLLALRNVSPLQTLRRDTDAEVLRMHWSDVPRIAVDVALVLSVVGIAFLRARTTRQALSISAATGVAILALVASAALLSWAARKGLRTGWPYVVRQGVANLYRPGNQTRAVVLALGFGAFLVSTLYLVQHNILRRFTTAAAESRGNVVFFDVQQDQAAGLDSIIRSRGNEVVQTAPVVTMRIAAINGKRVADLTPGPVEQNGHRAGWAYRREFRSTFRDKPASSETIVSGKWFGANALKAVQDTGEISLEEGIAKEISVKLGDIIVWNVQGVEIPTRITSLRKVVWTRFEPNFFVVFAPPALKDAPKQYVLLTQVKDPQAVTPLQRAVVNQYPNISSIDLTSIKRTVDRIVARVSLAIRFMALFSLAVAIPVLFSAVAATRRARVREGVLLRTLGATRGQIAKILLAEYSLLGVLGGLTGMLLAMAGGWAVVRYLFKVPFTLPIAPIAGIALVIVALTLLIGLLAGRDVFRETPIAALRDV
ncbi:MAG: putative transport system permease protein [Gemmatimonadaceae bacterium]|nr:putative transport system permease protein [Gemmatimonadaceae bacterium]